MQNKNINKAVMLYKLVTATVYRTESFPSKESDTKILHAYRAYISPTRYRDHQLCEVYEV